MMCELFGGAQADHPRDPLERVEATKEVIEHRAIDRAGINLVFQRDQRAADRDEVFVALGVVVVEELVEELATVIGVWVIHQLASVMSPPHRLTALDRKVLLSNDLRR